MLVILTPVCCAMLCAAVPSHAALCLGLQTQTAECLVVAEVATNNLVVALNKVLGGGAVLGVRCAKCCVL